MKQLVVFTVLTFTIVGVIISVLEIIPVPEYKTYDCTMAEFHPDYPKEVREECRKLRSNKIIHT